MAKTETAVRPATSPTSPTSPAIVPGTDVPVSDKQVEIVLTEQITGGDQVPEIAAKRERLIASMRRSGVTGEIDLREAFLGVHGRSLVASGMGKPIEMTEEMEKRRREESEAAANGALVALARSVEAKSGGAEAAAALAEAQRLNEETKKLADQIAAARAALEAAAKK